MSKWPKKGDSLLKEPSKPSRPRSFSLDWIRSVYVVDDSVYAKAYKDAADMLIDALKADKDVNHNDMIVMPIAYLYRHSLELKMKHLVSIGNELGLLEDVMRKKLADVMKKHDLAELWNLISKILNDFCPDASEILKEELKAVEQMIQQLHKMDNSGQNFKYTRKMNGKATIKQLPASIDLVQMKNMIDGIYNMLDGSDCALEAALDARQQG